MNWRKVKRKNSMTVGSNTRRCFQWARLRASGANVCLPFTRSGVRSRCHASFFFFLSFLQFILLVFFYFCCLFCFQHLPHYLFTRNYFPLHDTQWTFFFLISIFNELFKFKTSGEWEQCSGLKGHQPFAYAVTEIPLLSL